MTAALCLSLMSWNAAPTRAAPATAAVRTPNDIIAASPPTDWHPVPSEQLLVMDLSDGRRLLVQLAPEFAPIHVGNIQALARLGWWDGAAITRVQDDYVVQWSREPETRPRETGVLPHPPPEYDRTLDGLGFRPLPYPDPYAARVGFADGWPVATDNRQAWLPHCYGMVGVGRDLPPDTGDGAELYAVNGEAPRQLDRNFALVGRVVGGMDWLSTLPRGQGAQGFYADARDRIPIDRIRLAADLPPAVRPTVQVMDTGSPSFSALLAARANRRDPFYVRPLNGLAVCNAPVPMRVLPPGSPAQG